MQGPPQHTEKELELPDIPWFRVDKGFLRFREIAVLEWVCCVEQSSTWEGLEDTPFTNPIRHKMVRMATAHLRGIAVSLSLCQPLGLEMLLLGWMN